MAEDHPSTDGAPFDPTSLTALADPYPALAEARRQQPVLVVDGGFTVVTGHAEALDVLRSPSVRSGPIAAGYRDRLPPGPARDEMANRINFLDPPDHPRVRSLVSKAFTPRRVAAVRPWVEQTTTHLIDELDGCEELDLLHELAHQVPSLVISELLGVPPEDRDRLTALSDEVAPLLGLEIDAGALERALAAADELHAYLDELIEARRREPRDDLLSALLAAEEGGARLSDAELHSLVATLYSAGHRTTRDLFTNGMSVLLGQPERYEAVVHGAWSVPETVEEVLRIETPTIFVARVAAEDLTVGGVDVPAGAIVLVYLAAANRDPAAYQDPDAFRPGRDGPGALSFAFGAHYCLGASLARSETEVLLATVAARWPGLALAEPGEPSWHLRGPFPGVDRLLVRPQG